MYLFENWFIILLDFLENNLWFHHPYFKCLFIDSINQPVRFVALKDLSIYFVLSLLRLEWSLFMSYRFFSIFSDIISLFLHKNIQLFMFLLMEILTLPLQSFLFKLRDFFTSSFFFSIMKINYCVNITNSKEKMTFPQFKAVHLEGEMNWN